MAYSERQDKDLKCTEITVKEIENKIRLDQFICETMKVQSRNYYARLIKEGSVKVNGQVITKPSHTVKNMDKLIIYERETGPLSIKHEKMDLEILYEDEYLLAINKSRGIVVHPGAGNKEHTILNAVINAIDKDNFKNQERPGVIHRLDKETTGVLLIAKSEPVLRKLSDQFKNRSVEKTYVALVCEHMEYEKGYISLPISRSRVHRQKMAVNSTGKLALTEFFVLQEGKLINMPVTLVKVNIYTGRTHQIRVHMSYIGHPVVGDKKYSSRKFKNCPEIALHAHAIRFIHPITSKLLTINAPLPEDFSKLLDECGIHQLL